MAAVLKPFGNILNPGSFQLPTGQLAVDWTNPLTRDLIGCFIPGVMGKANLGLVNAPLSMLSAVNMAPTQHGPALKNTAANTGMISATLGATSRFVVWSKFSLFWYGSFVGAQSFGNTSMVGIESDATGTVKLNPGLFGLFTGGDPRPGMAFMSTGGSGVYFQTVTSPAFPGVMHSMAGVVINGSTPKLYLNGILEATSGSNAVTFTPSAPIINIGTVNGFFGNHPNALTNVGYFWDRDLSVAEIVQLHANPYSFLIPAEREMQSVFTLQLFKSAWARQSNLPVIGGGTF